MFYGQYDDIISLGWNCEVSARINQYLGILNSYVFSWIAIYNRSQFLSSLNDTTIILRNGSKIWDGTGGNHVMIKCNNTGFGIHTKLPKLSISNAKELSEALLETKSRINYLSEKFEGIFTKNQKVLFIIKPRITNIPCKEDIDFCLDVFHALINKAQKYNSLLKFDLLIMITQSHLNYFKHFSNFESKTNNKIFLKSVKMFSQAPNVINGGDIFGWLKVLSLFHYKNELKNKVFFLDKDNMIIPIEKNPSVRVKFLGSNSIIVIKNPSRIKQINVTLGSYSSVFIDENIDVFCNLEIYAPNKYSRIEIGKNCFFSNVLISMDKLDHLSLTIGNYCRMYSNVMFKNYELHTIFDLTSNTPVDSFKNISVGDHVLIYNDVTVLYSSNIPNNSIVLSNSVVHGLLDESNAIYGGCYAEIIRSNVNWKF